MKENIHKNMSKKRRNILQQLTTALKKQCGQIFLRLPDVLLSPLLTGKIS